VTVDFYNLLNLQFQVNKTKLYPKFLQCSISTSTSATASSTPIHQGKGEVWNAPVWHIPVVRLQSAMTEYSWQKRDASVDSWCSL